MGCSPSGCSVHGILQARILEWVAIYSSRGPSQLSNQTCMSYISRIGVQVFFLSLVPPGKSCSDMRSASFLEIDHGRGTPAFLCVASSFMVVGGPWALELELKLSRNTICFTWLFIRSLGNQPWLPVTNSPISHFLPSFLLCTSGIFSSSHDAFQLQPPPLSLGPSHRLVFHSPTLICHPPALTPPAASFFSTFLILTGLGKMMLKP